MRCPSCGFLNAAQAFECANCKTVLDPILSTLVVEAPASSASIPPGPPAWMSEEIISAPVWLSKGNAKGAPPRPPLPSVPSGPFGDGAAASTMVSSRYVPSSTDLDFLVASIGATKLKAPVAKSQETPVYAPVTAAKCPICGKMTGPENLVRTETKRQDFICRDCQARAATREEASFKRDKLLSTLGGFMAGASAGLICALLANQFGVSAIRHELNWSLTVAVGIIVGLAVRLGARNKPSMALQIVAVGLTLVTLVGSLYLCLNTLTATSLSLNGAFETLKTIPPQATDYILAGLSLLLAFVIPSGIIGGTEEPYTTEE